MTELLKVSSHAPDAAVIHLAAERLRAGGLVAFPTETVYGLGANALDERAVARIFEAKGRPADNPLIVHVADRAMARQVVSVWPEAADRLAEAFWPGPLTLVLPKSPIIPLVVTAGLPAVGVRMPNHPVALALIHAAGVPVAAPSANPYMGVSPTRAEHVVVGMADRVDLILDGGPADVGLESTVLDLSGEVPTVLRLGGLSVGRLRAVLGYVAVQVDAQGESAVRLPSPGLARRHYAPRATVRLVDGRMALEALAASLKAGGERVGVLAFGAGDWPESIEAQAMPRSPEAYGAMLYATFHAMDALGVTQLLVETPPSDEDWGAVRDRLRRATSL